MKELFLCAAFFKCGTCGAPILVAAQSDHALDWDKFLFQEAHCTSCTAHVSNQPGSAAIRKLCFKWDEAQ